MKKLRFKEQYVLTDEQKEAESLPPDGHYVYSWFNEEWGMYFYVGSGKGNRYKTYHGRGKHFTAILNNWTCFPIILVNNLTEEEAWAWESQIKDDFIFDRGYPIIDGEGRDTVIKNRAVQKAKQIKRATDPNWKEGRPKKEVPLFKEYYEKYLNGEISMRKSCKVLNISQGKWYSLVEEHTA